MNMPTQAQSGKAFEFALMKAFSRSIRSRHKVIQDEAYGVVRRAYLLFSQAHRERYSLAANAAVRHIKGLEPRLDNPRHPNGVLELQIMPDREGMHGDVRDILLIRSSENWEIGVSAKNNHKAVKHLRLSDTIDFGRDWLSIPCSAEYFASIQPIFLKLRGLAAHGEYWRNIPNKDNRFYVPILESFRMELKRIHDENGSEVPARLLKYLLGTRDFYKIIKRWKKVEIYGFNINGSLNKASGTIRPSNRVSRITLPNRIIEVAWKANSTNTLILTCSEGWQLSFRIHNASSLVEPSLKFDIKLEGNPDSLYANHLPW